MKWTDERSSHVDDRRGISGGKGLAVGGGLGTLIIAAIVFFLGGDPSAILNGGAQLSSGSTPTEQRAMTPDETKTLDLVKMITAWNEKTWSEIFQQNGMQYTPPETVLFTGQTQSACGPALSDMGPFYCPADQKIYVDMDFFNELHQRFGADVTQFTVAYVLAHETGHHVQDLLGTMQKVDQLRRSGRYSKTEMNRVSVAVELQADFYAGVWAKVNNERVKGGILEPGDIQSAVNAAQAVGDDNIQKRAQGYVTPDSFTHGTSAQRVEWFMKGYNTGDIRQGNTFDTLLK